MRRFFIIQFDSYQALNGYMANWQAGTLLSVDWHCYEGNWYAGILYEVQEEL